MNLPLLPLCEILDTPRTEVPGWPRFSGQKTNSLTSDYTPLSLIHGLRGLIQTIYIPLSLIQGLRGLILNNNNYSLSSFLLYSLQLEPLDGWHVNPTTCYYSCGSHMPSVSMARLRFPATIKIHRLVQQRKM